MSQPFAHTPVLGVRVSAISLEEAARSILERIVEQEASFVTVTGVHGVMEAQEDPGFKTVLNSSSLCVPDGMPLVWLSRAAGHRNVTRVFGPDLMLEVCRLLSEAGKSSFYYGGAEGVAEELAAEMTRRFPGMETAGTYCPPFRPLSPTEKGDVVDILNESGADIVWVGLSTPKQERWMAEFRPLLRAPVLIGVGAAFDYNTGKISRAPRLMQRLALEWLYRLLQEPARLWKRYLRNNPLFLYYLFLEKLGIRSFD